MTYIPSTIRLAHGHQVEKDFRDYINARPNWRACEIGQNKCDEQLKRDLYSARISPKSAIGQQMINLLPDLWRHVYTRGVGKNLPSLARWDADAICIYNNEPQFFAEIKSSITRTNNITIEMSCYMSALSNQLRLGLPLYFFFSPFENNPHWTFLELQQIPDCTVRILDGKGCSGSSTPFALISKDYLTQRVEDLFIRLEDEWLL